MPKTKARRKGTKGESHIRLSTPHEVIPFARGTTKMEQGRRRSEQTIGAPNPMSLLLPALVALGCWGMAISFIFFSTYADRYVFGGMAALMALMWSFSFALRVR